MLTYRIAPPHSGPLRGGPRFEGSPLPSRRKPQPQNSGVVSYPVGPLRLCTGVVKQNSTPARTLLQRGARFSEGKNGALVGTNDDWMAAQATEIRATGLAPTNDKESAILATLTPDNFTAIVAGKNNTQGAALIEFYKLN